jgi:photosystem II stability/assembly factor-like uncharacterized protein
VNSPLFTVDPVNRKVIWASGGGFFESTNDGAVVRSVDGGRNWRNVTPPDGVPQRFHDIEAFDAKRAVILAVGPGQESRIYRTDDGGTTWRRTFVNRDPDGFYDCMAFFDDRHGLTVGDPINGKFSILATADGGRSWKLLPTSGMPPTLSGEAARATGSCLVTSGRRDAWFGTQTLKGAPARVFHSSDTGRTWTVVDTPIPGGTDGIMSLSFRDRLNGLAVGGAFGPPSVGAAARTSDGGRTWVPIAAPAGFRTGVAWTSSRGKTAVTVGPSGSDFSRDAGRHWSFVDPTGLLGVACLQPDECWAVGLQGRAAHLVSRS